ncbi:MAG: 3-hydroxyisobutyrate dehydrogenase [Pseudomonadales bacterium]|nr:3-hydroxyisobutyrate dehydrogenase [Pseudomonadales bacterium]
MASIGFIGVGHMGAPMVINLLKAGHKVKVFDLNVNQMKLVAAKGASIAASAIDASKDVDVLISMLISGKVVEDIYLHDIKLLKHINTNTLVIDSSTIAAEDSRKVADAAKQKGIAIVDAPVSGGVAGAEAGTLSFMVGGDKSAFELAEPILKCMGKNIFHAGESGAGQTAKICNNMLLAIHMAGTAEALKMGVDSGLDPKVLSDIMVKSSGRNWSLELYNPYPGVQDHVPAANNYTDGFAVNLMNKDLGLAKETAVQTQTKIPMGSLAQKLFKEHAENGNGQLDFSSIQLWYE